MPPNVPQSIGNQLRVFLHNPKCSFISFFETCRGLAYRRLLSHRADGWHWSPGVFAGNQELADLAGEAIEPMFLPRKGRSQLPIVDYFSAQNFADVAAVSADEIERLFYPYFYQQMKQGLSRAFRRSHPELYRLRKNFDHILSSPEYQPVTYIPDGLTHASLHDQLRQNGDPVSSVIMDRLAMESLLATVKDTALCRDFFARLHLREDLQNFAPRRQLISCLVRARETFIKSHLPRPANMPTPELDLERTDLRVACSFALDQVQQWITTNWHQPQKVNRSVSDVMFQGCVRYIEDYCDSCGTDAKSTYFREVAPPELQADYDRLYKYNFLRLIGLTEKFFEEYLAEPLHQPGDFGAKV